ncbi:MAG: PEP-CTERM sorting domain-containing protein [Verrucomicrobiaceae bacterium]
MALTSALSAQSWVQSWTQIDPNTVVTGLPGGVTLTVDTTGGGVFANGSTTFASGGLSSETGSFQALAYDGAAGSITFTLSGGQTFTGFKMAGTDGSGSNPGFSISTDSRTWETPLQEVVTGATSTTGAKDANLRHYTPFVAAADVSGLNSFTLLLSDQTEDDPIGFAFGSTTAVPEPSSILLLSLTAAFCGARRKR